MDIQTLRLVYPSLLIMALIGPKSASGYIFCHCDTIKCRQLGSSECKAEFYCYTIFRFPISDSFIPYTGHSTDRPKYNFHPNEAVLIDRGCVANGFSTRCSPDHKQYVQNGTVLVTYCCRDAWCNLEKIHPSKLFSLESKKSNPIDQIIPLANGMTKHDDDPIQATKLNHENFVSKKLASNRVYQNTQDEEFSVSLHDHFKQRKSESKTRLVLNGDLTFEDRQALDAQVQSDQHPTQSDRVTISKSHLGALTKPAHIAMGAALVILLFGILLLSAAFYVYRKHQQLTRLSLHGLQTSNQPHSVPRLECKYNQTESKFSVQKVNSAFISHHNSRVNSTNEHLGDWRDHLAGAKAHGNINRCTCCRRKISTPSTEPYNYPDNSASELSLPDRMKKLYPNSCGSPEHNTSSTMRKTGTLPSNQIMISWIHSQRKQENFGKTNRKFVRSRVGQRTDSRCRSKLQPEKLKQSNSIKEPTNTIAYRLTSPGNGDKPIPWFTEIEINKSTDGTVNSEPLTSAIYSGASLNTDYSSSRDHNSDGALSSIIPYTGPGLIYQQLIHNNDACHGNLYPNNNHSPVGIQMLDRQRGTGKTSSGGEESKTLASELFDLKQNGWIMTRNFESSSGASTAATGRDTRNPKERNFDLLDQNAGNLIGLANFRKAQESNSELVTPYAQFELSPDSSVYNGCQISSIEPTSCI